jgi:hypothetical protein
VSKYQSTALSAEMSVLQTGSMPLCTAMLASWTSRVRRCAGLIREAGAGVDGETGMSRDGGVGRGGSESKAVMGDLLPHFARDELNDALAALFPAVGE